MKKLRFLFKITQKKILITTIIIIIAISTGIFRIVVDTNTINYYNKNSEIYKNDSFINKTYGGSTSLSIVATGDIKSPEVLNKIDYLEKQFEQREHIGEVTTIASVVKKMNKVLNEDKEEFNKIPENRNTVSELFLLYSMSGDPEDFEKLVDFNYKNALITQRLSSTSVNIIRDELKFTRNLIKDDKTFTLVGGFADILSDLVEYTVKGQLYSLLLSILIVAIIVGILFRSFSAALISTIPLAFSLAILFGLMGYLGIELNIITSMLTSIMIGVGVDYTIHFLWRYRNLKKQGYNDIDTIYKTLTTIGRGIIFNALSVVIGFVALMVSNFLPVQFFGFLVVVTISACLLITLVILPAICLIFKPKFLKA